MKVLYTKTIAIGFLFTIAVTDAQEGCKGGADCRKLPECSGLYAQLLNRNTPQLTRLLRTLHCGFQGETPKICCPPEFQFEIQPQNSQSEFEETDTRIQEENPVYTNNNRRPQRPQSNNGRPSHSGRPDEYNPGQFSGGTSGQFGGGGSFNRPSQSSAGNQEQSLLPDTKVCGVQAGSDRIVGGTQTEIDEHPWMALIQYSKPKGTGFYCGGVLISSRYVLTAAHCIKGADLPKTWRVSQVRLGEWNTSTDVDCVEGDCNNPPQDIPVEEIIPHEGYNSGDKDQQNDIALLRLVSDVQFNDFVKPICLPTSSSLKNSNFEGYTLEVAGWGKTESRSESDVKLKVKVPVVTRSQCGSVFSRVNREISNKQICAGGNAGEDSCRGDSGGALMGITSQANNWYAVGVVSYGPSPCGTPGWPGVYTRVGAYVDWIISKIRP